MINPAPAIRKAYYDLLNGAVEYEGAAVPVYEGEGVLVKYQIMMGELNTSENGDKHSFLHDCSQLIEVITEMPNANPTKPADTIAGIIMHLVQPTPRTTGIEVDGFQVIGLRGHRGNPIRETSQSGSKIVRLQIRYTFKANQISNV